MFCVNKSSKQSHFLIFPPLFINELAGCLFINITVSVSPYVFSSSNSFAFNHEIIKIKESRLEKSKIN